MARKESVDFVKNLERNVAQLNRILSGDVAYLSFGFEENGFASQCIGRKYIPGESDIWHAYTLNGSMTLDKPKTGWLSLKDMPERELDAKRVDFYLNPQARRGETAPNSSYVTLALSGSYAHNKLWHMFYFTQDFGNPIFDYRMSREDPDFVTLNASLIVLPGKKNIERLLDVRKKIIQDAPAFIEKTEWSQESERDRGHQVKTTVPNPYKNNPRPLDVFSAFGWPPEVKKLEGFFHHLPRLPNEEEFRQSILKISEASQLALPFAVKP